jgi:hypothetical protein
MIYQRQFNKILARLFLDSLIDGKLPNTQRLSSAIKEHLNNNQLIYKYIPQLPRSVFNNKIVNKQLEAISFDLETLYEELVDLFKENLKKLEFANINAIIHEHQLTELEHLLNSILFTFKEGDQFFINIYDNFSSYNKTDQTLSTNGIISLKEKALALPFTSKSVNRIPVSHLFKIPSVPVDILFPKDENILFSEQAAGTSFGDIFSDITSSWIYQVKTNNPNGAAIQFNFQVTEDELEEIVGRFEIISASSGPQKIRIETSSDNINFSTPQGFEDGIILNDQSKTFAMDFEDRLVQYVKITLSKDSPDIESVTNSEYIYRFGLKSFSLLSAGRTLSATYYSKEFDLDTESIAKASLDADLSLPDNTNIEFSIKAISDNIESQWFPIKPISLESISNAPSVINFGNTKKYSKTISAINNAFSLYKTTRGINYYKLDSAVVNVAPIPSFGSAELFRGVDTWTRTKSSLLNRKTRIDNYISFTNSDIERFSAIQTEIPQFQKEGNNIVLLTNKPPYYDSFRGHTIIPDPGKNNPDAANYAIYKVNYITKTPKRTIDFTMDSNPITPTTIRFQVNNNTPILKVLDSSSNILHTLTIGKDFTVTFDSYNKPTGEITILPEAITKYNITVGGTPSNMRLEIVIDPDITHTVSSIHTNRIVLNNLSFDKTEDTFQITYRFLPLSPSVILKSSIVVRSNISTASNAIIYKEGTDYTIDSKINAIRRLPGGTIPEKGHIYADFIYEDAQEGIETFTTWCYVAKDGTQISFKNNNGESVLIADKTKGERFFINGPDGLVELTKSSLSPILSEGWTQFIVRSKNPVDNKKTDNTGNLIDQVIQLKDIYGNMVFDINTGYFTKVIATRNSMKHVSISELTTNTLISDHTKFAIDSSNYKNGSGESLLVLNFNPNSLNDLYLYKPSKNSTIPSSYYEVFNLSWDSIIDDIKYNKLKVRIKLSKSPVVTIKSVTPKVFSYTIKAF